MICFIYACDVRYKVRIHDSLEVRKSSTLGRPLQTCVLLFIPESNGNKTWKALQGPAFKGHIQPSSFFSQTGGIEASTLRQDVAAHSFIHSSSISLLIIHDVSTAMLWTYYPEHQ